MIFERGIILGRQCIKLEQEDFDILKSGGTIINEFGQFENYNPTILYIIVSKEQWEIEHGIKLGCTKVTAPDTNTSYYDNNTLLKKLKELI